VNAVVFPCESPESAPAHDHARRAETPARHARRTLAFGLWWLSLAVLLASSPATHGAASSLASPTCRVVFAGGLEIEQWPAKTDFPKSLRLICQEKEIPLTTDHNQLVASLPLDALDHPGAEIEVRLPGWQTLKLTLPPAQDEKPFDTQVTPFLPGLAEPRTATATVFVLKERQHLKRHSVSIPSTIIPEDGTDYAYLEAKWVRPISTEPEAAPPPANPIVLPIAKGQIDRPLPTGIYDFTLRGAGSEKVEIRPHLWKAEVPVTAQTLDLGRLPSSLAGEYLGLVLVFQKKSEQENAVSQTGYFFTLAAIPKLASVKAVVNALRVKSGEVVSFSSIEAEKDNLGVLENVKLVNPVTLEFDAVLMAFDYHWTLKVDERGTRFMYGNLVELKSSDFEREKLRLEEKLREKAPGAYSRLHAWATDKYREEYEGYLNEAKENAQTLKETYPLAVEGCSIYFALHPANEKVSFVRLKNGIWDLQKAK